MFRINKSASSNENDTNQGNGHGQNRGGFGSKLFWLAGIFLWKLDAILDAVAHILTNLPLC